MSLRVTVTDTTDGTTDTVLISDGDYVLICAKPCRLAHTQAHANGTHILTVKDHNPLDKPERCDLE